MNSNVPQRRRCTVESTVAQSVHLSSRPGPSLFLPWGTFTDPTLPFYAAWQPGRSKPTVMVTIQHFVFVRSTSSLLLPLQMIVCKTETGLFFFSHPPLNISPNFFFSTPLLVSPLICPITYSELTHTHMHAQAQVLTHTLASKLHPALCVRTRALCSLEHTARITTAHISATPAVLVHTQHCKYSTWLVAGCQAAISAKGHHKAFAWCYLLLTTFIIA